jgi:hypothetical protein
MLTTEIPRTHWSNFFDKFSKQHEGWIVTLEVLGGDIGAQEAVARLPLVGISAELQGPASRLEIMVGGRPEAHFTHIISMPKRVWLKQPEEAAHEAVEIESADGTTTLVHFHHIPPEEAERLLPEKE